MRWVAFFSQTGKEIMELSEKLNRFPDVIITNKLQLSNVHPDLPFKLVDFVPVKPESKDYLRVLKEDDFITLHGYLRIIPPEICERYKIYNGHPGLITKYEQLKGKDPQIKAVQLGLETSGCVIHEVTKEVDGGKILKEKEISIKGLDERSIYKVLHNCSVELWYDFLKEKFK